jgi:hypothetical protein
MAYDKNILAAIDEATVSEIFKRFISGFEHVAPVNVVRGRFRLTGNIKFDIPRGKIEFISTVGGDFVRLDEVDIRTDLNLSLRFTTPEIAIPRACVNVPCNGRLCTPRIVLVPSVTITVPLDLPPITSEVSGDGSIVPVHDVPAHLWRLKLQLNPLTADIDLIDIADTLGDLFESVMDDILDAIFGGTISSVIYAIIGDPIEWLLRTVLDVADDLSEWFFRLLSDNLGLHNLFAEFLEMLTGQIFLAEFPDEQDIFPAQSPSSNFPAGLSPVRIAIDDVMVDVNSHHELVVGANVGSP